MATCSINLIDFLPLSAFALFSVDDFQWGRKNRPSDSLNSLHTLCPCHLIDRCTFSFFYSLLLTPKLSIYCHFHYSEQNGEILRSVLGIWRLMNWVDCSDCRSICVRYLRTANDMFRVTMKRWGTKSFCCVDIYQPHYYFFLVFFFIFFFFIRFHYRFYIQQMGLL